MGRKASPGLLKRGKYWHIDKYFLGCRLRESTGAITLEEAERYLNRRLEEIREARVYGVRPERLFKQAATKFLLEHQHKRSIRSYAGRLAVLVKFIGDLPLTSIHMVLYNLILRRGVKLVLKPEPLTMNYKSFEGSLTWHQANGWMNMG